MTQISDELVSILQKYWGYNSFRMFQMEALEALLSKRDVLALMSTGSGKSLLFQLLPVLFRERGILSTSIVISPLISLMEDQISSLTAMGIKAGMLGGNTSYKDEEKAISGGFAVLYMTPEKILNWEAGLQSMTRHVNICCLGIDERYVLSTSFNYLPT
jgi:ATP-dependent DNA helicase RecQ